MELNNKIFKYGLMLIILSLIFTIGFSLVYKLKTPVFLKMYVERSMTDYPNLNLVENFELKYITDVSDKRRIIDIQFKEEPNMEVFVSDRPAGGGFSPFNNHNFNNQQDGIYGRYIIKPIYLRMELNDINKEFFEVTLNNAKITFDDGSTQNIDLGEIILYKDERREDTDSKPTFDFVSGSSSSSFINGDNLSSRTSTTGLEVNEDINLTEVKSPILDNVKDYIEISIDDIDYSQISGVEYEKGKVLNAYSKFEPPEDIVNKYIVYDMKPKLYYENKDGKISYTRIDNIDYIPYNFDLLGIFNYLRARGEI